VRRATLIAALLALLVAAPSALAASWQTVGAPSPGGQPSLTVLNGVPYVASLSPAGALTVKRGEDWAPVGGPLNHDATQPARAPQLIAGAGTLWVTWRELDAAGLWQVRLAKLVGGGWRELGGGARPINHSGESAWLPRIALLGATPYVSYASFSGKLDVVRYVSGKIQHVVTGLSTRDTADSGLVSQGGQLFLVYAQGDTERESRLNDTQTGWVTIFRDQSGGVIFNDLVVAGAGAGKVLYGDDYGFHRVAPDGGVTVGPNPGVHMLNSLAFVGGVGYAAGIDGDYDSTSGTLHLAELRRGAWQALPSPADTGYYATTNAQLLRVGTTLWMAWGYSAYTIDEFGDPQYEPPCFHVARLVPQ
jgi:hypothetical protein